MRRLLARACFGSGNHSALLAGLALILVAMAMTLVTRPALLPAAAGPPDFDQIRGGRRFGRSSGCGGLCASFNGC